MSVGHVVVGIGRVTAPSTTAWYLEKIGDLKSGYLDAKWNEAGGWYRVDSGGIGFPDVTLNAAMVATTAILANRGLASATDKTRALTVVAKMIAAPAYAGETWWSGMDGTGDHHAARDQPAAEGLYWAYKYRTDLGMDAPTAATVLHILTVDHALGYNVYQGAHSLDPTDDYGGQTLPDWHLNRIIYGHLTGVDYSAAIRTCVSRFLQYVDETHPAGPGGSTEPYLFADFGFNYADAMDFPPWEYDAMCFGSFAWWYPDLVTEFGLTAGELALVKAWQRRHLGMWTRAGYPNWDTGYSDMRLHSIAYWMWGLRSLMGIVHASGLNQDADDAKRAKWLLDKAVERWGAWDEMDGDPADDVPPAFLFDGYPPGATNYLEPQVDNTWSKEIAAAKLMLYLAEFVEAGVGDLPSVDPGNLWGWNWTKKSVYVSTASYYAASLAYAPNPSEAAYFADAVQLQHWGPSRIGLPNGDILTAIGGTGQEGFSFRTSRDGVKDLDTSDNGTTPTTHQVWRDGVEETRTDYDTDVIAPTFATSIRALNSKAGTNYTSEVDTYYYASKITTTHRATLSGAAGHGSHYLSIPIRKNATIVYVASDDTETVVWDGSTVTAAGSPAPASCRRIEIRWARPSVTMTITPTAATLGTGAKVTASAAAIPAFPRREVTSDRSLLIYLADSIAVNVGSTEITLDITVGGTTTTATPLARDYLTPGALPVSISATTEQAEGTWYKLLSGTGAVSIVAAPAELNGEATAIYVNAPDASASAIAGRTWSKASLDASSGVVKFDASLVLAPTNIILDVRAHDAAHAILNATTLGAQDIALFGAVSNLGANVNTTLLARSVNTQQKQTMMLDIKNFLLAKLNSGKTWADVDHVCVFWRAAGAAGGVRFYVNNFR